MALIGEIIVRIRCVFKKKQFVKFGLMVIIRSVRLFIITQRLHYNAVQYNAVSAWVPNSFPV